MAGQDPAAGAAGGRTTPLWARLAFALQKPWVRLRLEQPEPGEGFDPARPWCYVLEREGLSYALVLEQACREAGLPGPFQAAHPGLPRRRPRLVLTRRRALPFGRRDRAVADTRGLEALVARAAADPEFDCQLVPVSVFVGRAPDRNQGWFRVLFSEHWAITGWFQRALALIFNGRNTWVRIARPVSLRGLLEGEIPPGHATRKLARVLRTHFRRVRTAMIGADLSHRRMLIERLVAAPAVREAIAAQAARDGSSLAAAEKQARKYAWEIAADYSHPFVRSMSFLLTGFWNRIYDGVRAHHLDTAKRAADSATVIYVPCHRSHIDYLILSYLLYRNGLVPPHIAAGVNLNMPLVGPFLRRGGAFFLRRSFKGNALYPVVFAEYVDALYANGTAIEYFIEGGRSRTGRLLAPKAGMLAMTVRSFLRTPQQPARFLPVYIGYEKLIEGRSYLGELAGKGKRKESVFGLLGSLRILRRKYGQAAVSFGEPIDLHAHMDAHAPQWRAERDNPRAEWLNPAVDALAQRIQVEVNRAAEVNAINLVALAILSAPKHALGEADLKAQIALLQTLFTALPYSGRVVVCADPPEKIVAWAEKLGWLRRASHPLGDVLSAEGDQGVLLSYYRNNVLHLVVCAAWIACCLLNNREISRASVGRIGRIVYPFLKNELFLHWDADGFVAELERTADVLIEQHVLTGRDAGRRLRRPTGGTLGQYQLRLLAHCLLQSIERYYIGAAVLVRSGSGVLTAGELENLCHLTAQRLSLLQEMSAPEFFDKALFRGFIQQMRELGVIGTDGNGKLTFDQVLADSLDDARRILSREIRHGILKLTPEARAAVADATPD
ncbi:MAG: glycerol-3-phosphate 1-O-acyltransferase PlsB [Xanthomonadales bacterium]|nr:glycerol-3-phosphate 1-O-acyltransferase PlsB [Xanthomonadales bacterium]